MVYNRPIVHPGNWTQVSRGTEFVHPMLEVLFYSTLTCTQADTILLRIDANQNLSSIVKIELVETVKESSPQCDWYWDAND